MNAARDRGAAAIRGGTFAWGSRTFVMAIVNVTPDSFSGDGIADPDAAAQHGIAQWKAGADWLDVGGESTRPGHVPVDVQTEIARVVPAIAALRDRLPSAPISVDTYKAPVARAAHAAGADAINSVWGASDELLDVAAECDMAVVATHNRHGTHDGPGGVVDEVLTFLDDCATRAVLRGIAPERVLLDPGIGFGKTADQNIAVLRSLDRVVALGFPTLLGASRKNTIGKLTGRAPHDRVSGTLAIAALAVRAGVDVLRVHDVAAARDAVAVSDAIVRDWRPDGWTG
ncbi:MAG TPA: dihydropteroate synthase [Candidatus Tumulicola sp.]|nr:dihydropteroate synthase [Candidatus Tumulicola sp.]